MNQPSLFDDAAPVAAPKKPRTSRTRVQRIVELREQAGELYQQADELLAEVIAAEKVGASFKLNDGRTFAVVDHFQDKEGNPRNKAWKPAGVTRFDVEELKPSRSRRK